MVIVDCSNSFLGRTGNYNKKQSWNLSACFQFQNHCFFDFFAARNPVGLGARPCLHDGKITNAHPQCVAEIIRRTTPRPRSPIGTRFFHISAGQRKLPKSLMPWPFRPLLHCKGGRKTAIAQFTLDSSALFCMPWQKARRKGQVQQAMNQGCWFWNRAYKSVTSMPYYLVVDFLHFSFKQTVDFRLGWPEVSTASENQEVIKMWWKQMSCILGKGLLESHHLMAKLWPQ